MIYYTRTTANYLVRLGQESYLIQNRRSRKLKSWVVRHKEKIVLKYNHLVDYSIELN